MSPAEVLAAQPAAMKIWLAWMFAVNFASVLFLRTKPARWVLTAQAASVVSMLLLLRVYGSGHHLSLPHILFWTPLLAYLYARRRELLAWSPLGVWCALLFSTDLISLVFDYAAAAKLLFAAR